MPSIKGPAYGGKTKGLKPHAFLWCSRLEKGGYAHRQTALNCVIEVPKTQKCTWNGEAANCVQTAHIYTEVGAPKWRGFKGGKK